MRKIDHVFLHCFPTIPKTKVDIHVFSAVEKIFFDMLSLKNIISDIETNVSNKQEKFGVNPYIGYEFV